MNLESFHSYTNIFQDILKLAKFSENSIIINVVFKARTVSLLLKMIFNTSTDVQSYVRYVNINLYHAV